MGEQLCLVDIGYVEDSRVGHSELWGHAARDMEVWVGGKAGHGLWGF